MQDPALIEAVYTPDSSVTTAGSLLRRLGSDLLASRDLAWRLLVRDLSAQYRQSVLGYVWAFVPPVLMAASLTLASRASILNVGASDLPYPLFVLVGTVLWQTFSDALNGPLGALSSAKPLLARIRLPYEAIILAKLGEVAFNLLLKLLLVAAAVLYFQVELSAWILLAPLALFVLILFGTALGLLLAPLGGLYEDVARIIPLVLTVWFLLTPVVYQSAAPGSLVDWMNYLNPVTALLVTSRELLTAAAPSQPLAFGLMAVVTLPLLLLGWCFYRFSLPFVIERFSA